MGPGIGPPQGTYMEQQSPPGRVGSTGSAAKSAQFPSLLCLAEFQGCSPGVCAAGGISVKEGTPSSVCLWWRFIAWGGSFSPFIWKCWGWVLAAPQYGEEHRKHLSRLLTIFAPRFFFQTTRSSTSTQAVKVRPHRVSAWRAVISQQGEMGTAKMQSR